MTLASTGLGTGRGAGLLDGFVEADPTVAAILVGAIVVAAIAFVVVRVRAARRGR